MARMDCDIQAAVDCIYDAVDILDEKRYVWEDAIVVGETKYDVKAIETQNDKLKLALGYIDKAVEQLRSI